MNPGLRSGLKSALPLTPYFPDHSSIPQEKFINFFLHIRPFLTLAQHHSTTAYFFVTQLSKFWGADCFAHLLPRQLFQDSFLLPASRQLTLAASPEQQQEHRILQLHYTPSSKPAHLHARSPCSTSSPAPPTDIFITHNPMIN